MTPNPPAGGGSTELATPLPGAPPASIPGSEMSYRPNADLAIDKIDGETSGLGGLFGMIQLSGTFHVTVKNNGPDAVKNLKVDVWCGVDSMDKSTGSAAASTQNSVPVVLNLAAGKSLTVDTGLHYDLTKYNYHLECKIIYDPNDLEDPYTFNAHQTQDFK